MKRFMWWPGVNILLCSLAGGAGAWVRGTATFWDGFSGWFVVMAAVLLVGYLFGFWPVQIASAAQDAAAQARFRAMQGGE